MTNAGFSPRAPWWGGDLQTVRNYLLRDYADLSEWPRRRLTFDPADGSGDQLVAALNQAGIAKPAHLAILIHGLTGCETSAYMLATAYCLLTHGYDVLRLNLRGAGPSRALCRGQYHAGRTDDLRAVLAALPDDIGGLGISAVGFSLGGNVLLKYLAEDGSATPLVAADTVSAPIDLAASARHFDRRRNWPYKRWLLARMRAEVLATLGVAERDAQIARAARSIVAFDDRFTAPRNGFHDAADYYAQCSAQPLLADIAVPTLVMHARNDPWVPAAPYAATAWHTNDRLVPLIAGAGGHVGFHGKGATAPWYAERIVSFLATQTARVGVAA